MKVSRFFMIGFLLVFVCSIYPLITFASGDATSVVYKVGCRSDDKTIPVSITNNSDSEQSYTFFRNGDVKKKVDLIGAKKSKLETIFPKSENEIWKLEIVDGYTFRVEVNKVPWCHPTGNVPKGEPELTITQLCRNDESTIALQLHNQSNHDVSYEFKRVSDGQVFAEEPGTVPAHGKVTSPLPGHAGEHWIVHTKSHDYNLVVKKLESCKPISHKPPKWKQLTITQVCRNDTSTITLRLHNNSSQKVPFEFKRLLDNKVFNEEPGEVPAHATVTSPLPSTHTGEKWIVSTPDYFYPLTVRSLQPCKVAKPKPPTDKAPELTLTQVCRVDASTIALRLRNNSNHKVSFGFKRVSDGQVFNQEPGVVPAGGTVISPIPSTHAGEQWIVHTSTYDYPITIGNLSMCKGGKIPKTATSYPNNLFVGGVLLVLGTGCLLFIRRRVN
jgi:hypothetical protein